MGDNRIDPIKTTDTSTTRTTYHNTVEQRSSNIFKNAFKNKAIINSLACSHIHTEDPINALVKERIAKEPSQGWTSWAVGQADPNAPLKEKRYKSVREKYLKIKRKLENVKRKLENSPKTKKELKSLETNLKKLKRIYEKIKQDSKYQIASNFMIKQQKTLRNYVSKVEEEAKNSIFLEYLLKNHYGTDKHPIYSQNSAVMKDIKTNKKSLKELASFQHIGFSDKDEKMKADQKKIETEQKERIDQLQDSVKNLTDIVCREVKNACINMSTEYRELGKKLGKHIITINNRAFNSWKNDLKKIEAYRDAGQYRESIRLAENLARKVMVHPLSWRTAMVTDLDKIAKDIPDHTDTLNLFAGLTRYKYMVSDLIKHKTVAGKVKVPNFNTMLKSLENSIIPKHKENPRKYTTIDMAKFLSSLIIFDNPRVPPGAEEGTEMKKAKGRAIKIRNAILEPPEQVDKDKPSALEDLYVNERPFYIAWANTFIKKTAQYPASMTIQSIAAIRAKYDGNYSNNVRDIVDILHGICEDVKKHSKKGVNIYNANDRRKFMRLITDIFIQSCRQSPIKGQHSYVKSADTKARDPLILMLHNAILKQEGSRSTSLREIEFTDSSKFDTPKKITDDTAYDFLAQHLMRLDKLYATRSRTDLEPLLIPHSSSFETLPTDSFGTVNTLSSLYPNKKFSKDMLNYSVLCINGIQNDYSDAKKNALAVSKLIQKADGTCPDIHFVANPTKGGSDTLINDASTQNSPSAKPQTGKTKSFATDIKEAISNKYGYPSAPSFLLAASLRALYEKDPFKPILLIAHSQGGALARNALALLNSEVRENIHAIGVAPAIYIPDNRCAEGVNMYIKGDTVGDIFNLRSRYSAWIKKNMRWRKVKSPIQYMDVGHLQTPGSPANSDKHTFVNENYQKAIQMAMYALNKGKSIKSPFADILGASKES